MKAPVKPKKRPSFGRKGVPKWKKDKPAEASLKALARSRAKGVFA